MARIYMKGDYYKVKGKSRKYATLQEAEKAAGGASAGRSGGGRRRQRRRQRQRP